MTEAQARKLADLDKHYYPRKLRGHWMVWDGKSDHCVEFAGYTIDAMMAEDLYREKGE